jgi:hypothetical protein
MGKVTFTNTNTLSQHVLKLNDLSTDVGDLVSLNTTVDSDIVGAINELKSNVDSIGTNLDVNIRDAITVSNTAGKSGSIIYDNTTGQITYTGPDSLSASGAMNVSSTNVISVDNATTVSKGVASFSANNFETFLGAVSIKDSGISTSLYQDNSITSAKFSGTTTLLIQNSSGVTLKTIYSPGS